MYIRIADMFGIAEKQARVCLDEIRGIVVKNWRILAKRYGLSRGKIERMAPAFDMEFK